jgi:hypothetical protein
MSFTTPTTRANDRADTGAYGMDVERPARRRMTETKAAYKTTEFFVYIASVIAVIIASAAVGTNSNHADYFRADKAWFYIVLLTLGYLGSRGLAKSGSREHDNS